MQRLSKTHDVNNPGVCSGTTEIKLAQLIHSRLLCKVKMILNHCKKSISDGVLHNVKKCEITKVLVNEVKPLFTE